MFALVNFYRLVQACAILKDQEILDLPEKSPYRIALAYLVSNVSKKLYHLVKFLQNFTYFITNVQE
jgi:hypothetical protein